jgi:hypothetical protein
MTETAGTDEEASKSRQVVTSILVVLFTTAVGLMCILALACTLTQARLTAIPIDGVNIGIWKLDDTRTQWKRIRDRLRDQSEALIKAKQQLDDAKQILANNDSTYHPARTPLDAELQAFRREIRAYDPDLAIAMVGSPAEQVSMLDLAKDRLLKDHSNLQDSIKKITDLDKTYEPIYAERMMLEAKFTAKKEQVKALNDSLTSLQDSLDGLFRKFSTKPLDDTTRVRLENALFELYSGRALGSSMHWLLVMPPDILTLVLVISMGVLGSALQMTHALFRQNRIERPGAYFLRLGVGAITALVIFIVAKAGVPVIADASRLGGDAPINPYFVSFLAIISGLMSENAIMMVQAQGAKFFASETAADPQRWARFDLHDAFAKANRSPSNVRQLLNTEDAQFEGWISGKDAIPGAAQIMIAGVLELPRRDLFTDIPPDDAK